MVKKNSSLRTGEPIYPEEPPEISIRPLKRTVEETQSLTLKVGEEKVIVVRYGDSIDNAVPHHIERGSRKGEVDKEKLAAALALFRAGRIQFLGPYHESMKNQVYQHLMLHSGQGE